MGEEMEGGGVVGRLECLKEAREGKTYSFLGRQLRDRGGFP